MSVLELIRKNSIIVLVAVFGVGVGLIMMDYADKGSMIGGNSYVKVNGTGYSYQEIFNLGENGKEYIQQLVQASNGKLVDRFDADDNDSLSDDERAALQAYVAADNIRPVTGINTGLYEPDAHAKLFIVKLSNECLGSFGGAHCTVFEIKLSHISLRFSQYAL